MPAQYRYKPLLDAHHVRLVQVIPSGNEPHGFKLSLSEAELDQAPLYSALSYTWGDALFGVKHPSDHDYPTYEVQCDNGVLHITENLFNFLLRKSDIITATPLWIDAICIDQCNLAERGQQVSMMGEIYKSARRVLVWLREEQPPAEVIWVHDFFIPKLLSCRSQVNDYDFWAQRDPFCKDPEIVSLLGEEICQQWQHSWVSFFEYFIPCRWFTRGWVIQEVALKHEKNVLVLCGSEVWSWSKLQNFAWFLDSSNWVSRITAPFQQLTALPDLLPDSPIILTPNIWIQMFTALTPPIYEDNIVDVPGGRRSYRGLLSTLHGVVSVREVWLAKLSKLAEVMRSSSTTDPRDRIYAFLGLADESRPWSMKNPIVVSYEIPVVEVFTSFTSLLLTQKPLLTELSDVEDASTREIAGLPSWVPDYSVAKFHRSLIRTEREYSCIGNEYGIVGSEFNASKTHLIAHIPPLIVGPVLTLHGARIDSISVNGEEFFVPGYPDFLLDFFLKLDLKYPFTGEQWNEAVSRTLIADSPPPNLPSPDLPLLFHEWLLYLIAWRLQELMMDMIENKDIISAIMKQLRRVSADSIYRRSLPGFEEVMKAVHDTPSCRDVLNQNPYYPVVRGTMLLRRLYQSKNRYLGIGQRSLQNGDEIWLLGGARVPFILRKRTEGGYTLIGETYVHGMMRGEMMTDELVERMGPVGIH